MFVEQPLASPGSANHMDRGISLVKNKAMPISAKLLELNLMNKLEETGRIGKKQEKKGRNRVDQVRFSVRIGKSRNLSKIVSVLLSASVERVGVSRMRDFFCMASLTKERVSSFNISS